MPISDDVLQAIVAAIKQPLDAARVEARQEGCEIGRLRAIQEMEAEVVRLLKADGTADSEAMRSLAFAAGWLRKRHDQT